MPADERSFTDEPPDRLALDTDFIIAYLIDTEPHHARCRAFMQRLEVRGRTALYVSSLCWIELANVIMKERLRASLSEEARRRFRLRQWQDEGVRQAYLQSMIEAFETMLAQFAWNEVTLAPTVRQRATRYIARYRLSAHDAVHVASADYAGVTDFVALDEAYRRVDGITLWNDLIHAGKPVRGSGGG